MTLSTLQFLLRGYPGELVESERAFFVDQAHRAIGLPSLNDLQRHRIRSVWLDGKYMAPIGETPRARK